VNSPSKGIVVAKCSWTFIDEFSYWRSINCLSKKGRNKEIPCLKSFLWSWAGGFLGLNVRYDGF
jgi:hypothetical protein